MIEKYKQLERQTRYAETSTAVLGKRRVSLYRFSSELGPDCLCRTHITV